MPKLMRMFCGVDPGKKGGIAVITDSEVVLCEPMPKTKKDVWELVKEVQKYRPTLTLVEKVHSMPGQGVKSTFTFGRGYGWLEMAFTAADLRLEDVTPQTWMKGLKIPSRSGKSKTEHKNLLKEKAQGLFPNVTVTLSTADALLIAEYLRRRTLGNL